MSFYVFRLPVFKVAWIHAKPAYINCGRDEYPPIGFWQVQNIHNQWVRMVPQAQNGPAGAALFGLGICKYDAKGQPPASTRNAAFDRLVHGRGRDTEIWTADVTTTLHQVTIGFPAYPNEPDFGLTANPCWPSTLINDPGFALLTSDIWYFDAANAHRLANRHLYANPPPLAYTQNNPPRPNYQKRSFDQLHVEMPYNESNSTHRQLKEYFDRLGAQKQLDQDLAEGPRAIIYRPRYWSSSKAS